MTTSTVFDVQSLAEPKTLALASLIALVFLAVVYYDRPIGVAQRKGIRKVPGALPLVGNIAFALNISSKRKRFLDEVLRLQRDTGKGGQPFTITMPAMGGRVTVINNPAYIQHIQKTNFSSYPKGPEFTRFLGDVLSPHGIFVADGDVWLKQRKLASHIFSFNNFRSHVQTVVVKEIQTLDSLLKDASTKKATINLPDLFLRFTLSSFSLLAFDADVECLPSNVQGLKIANEFADNFDFAQAVMDGRTLAILPRWTEYFTVEGYKMRKAIRNLNSFCYRIIDSRLARRETSGDNKVVDKSGKDLLELFADQGLTREELLPVILNFLIAGRDTTAQSLAWLFVALHKNPEVVEKIRESIIPVLGSPEDQRPMLYEEIKDLPYLNACFYEAVRLWPAVPKNTKHVLNDDIIRPVGESWLPDVDVRKGESVAYSDWAMARMPEVWGDDCEEFKPERFLEEGSDGQLRVKEYSQFKFHAFNAGPRLCLGKTLATYEGMAVVAAVLGRYDVTFDDNKMRNEPPTYGDSLTLPCTPYHVGFKSRV